LENIPRLERVAPARELHGIRGHAWEQIVLPRLVPQGATLWSPSHSGPVRVKGQVVTIHDLIPIDAPHFVRHRFRLAFQAIVPRVVRDAKAVIAVSEHTAGRLEALLDCPRDKIHVVPHGADPPRHWTCPGDHADFVLSLGSLAPRKNLPRLLEAWKDVYRPGGPELWIAGRQDLAHARVLHSPHGPGVRWLGSVPQDEKPHLLGCALALAYPSLYEGFGLPVLEAMTYGTPVLTSNVTALPEVVRGAGVMVDPHDVQAIANGLRDVMAPDAARRFGAEGRRLAARRSWQDAARETVAAFE
jgi:glycosyltransferase involved in cell wall biosynthesis